jgi:hypothetical protein
MNGGSASPSSVSPGGRRAGTVSALRRQNVAVASSSIAFAALGNVGSVCPSPASAGALRHQVGFLCAHVLRRSREPIAFTRSANSMRVAPVLLQPPAGRRVGLSSTHPVRLAPRPAPAAACGLCWQGRHRSLARAAPARSTPGMPPNMSVNRTRYGMAPWPRCARCHCCATRPGSHASARRLPLRSASPHAQSMAP